MPRTADTHGKEPHLRRVQVTGGSTFAVSIPKSWARQHRLAGGAILAITSRPDGSLAVRPAGRESRESAPARLEAGNLSGDALLRRLIGAYLSGHDVVDVRAAHRFGPAQREAIRRFTRICAGPEILEETADRVVLRDLVDPGEVTPESVAARLFGIARAMFQDALDALERGDSALAQDVIARDDEVDRLYRLIAKRFAKSLQTGALGANEPAPYDGLRLLLCARLVERCADHAEKIAGHAQHLRASALSGTVRDSLLAFGRNSLDLLDRAFSAFRQANLSGADGVVAEIKHHEHRKEEILDGLARRDPEHVATWSLVIESLERIRQYASDVAELALNGWPAQQ